MTQSTSRAYLLLAIFGLVNFTSAFAQQNVEVSEQDGLFSVKANNTSASELAEELSDTLGINVVVTGDTETLVNVDIVEEPLDIALSMISPNNMLIRSGKEIDSDIIEVVLMMGEGTQSEPATGAEQFLPSGSPAEEVIAPEQPGVAQSPVGAELRDPNRAQVVRDAADAAANDAAIGTAVVGQSPEAASDSPEAQTFDPVTGLPIDPATGLPVD